jgi:chromate reductase, NAD(P)H dehydrogenase (quinone)
MMIALHQIYSAPVVYCVVLNRKAKDALVTQDLVIDQPLQLLAISGSLRVASSNTAVLQALLAVAPANMTILLYEELAELPYFNPDLDREGDTPPTSVRALRERIGRADGLMICSPEYAHGVPGVLKNALDWLVSSLEFPGKLVALINISPRSTYVQASLSETLKTMSAALISDAAFTIPLPPDRRDVAAMLADAQIARALQVAIAAFSHAIVSGRSAADH